MIGELHVVILAAGEGKRMHSCHPKVLQPVAGTPMLAHVIRALGAMDCSGIHVVVGHAGDEVRILLDALADDRISIVEQRQRLGTGHAVQQAIGRIPASARVLVLPGDMPLIRAETLHQFCRLDAGLAILSFIADDPTGYGRILRDDRQRVTGIREQRDASPEQAAIREVNSGVLIAEAEPLADWLSRIDNQNRQGEYYLTDIIELAADDGVEIQSMRCADVDEPLGANTMAQLAVLEAALQRRYRNELLEAGVRMPCPETVQVRAVVDAGRDVVIDAGVVLEGEIALGDDVLIGIGTVVRDCRLASGTRIEAYCVLEGVETTGACRIGPFARLRAGTSLAADTRIGNFVETKNARFGSGAKASHLSYIGDAEIGAASNIGAGTITCNYDGFEKHRTVIGARAFIGSNSSLIAPVRIGAGATIGAGSVISTDAPDGKLTITRVRQKVVPGWRRRRKNSR